MNANLLVDLISIVRVCCSVRIKSFSEEDSVSVRQAIVPADTIHYRRVFQKLYAWLISVIHAAFFDSSSLLVACFLMLRYWLRKFVVDLTVLEVFLKRVLNGNLTLP